jgi:hypothetical protein
MMNYVELIVATLSGMPEREREQVLASVAKKFGYVLFAGEKPNAKPTPANGPTDKDIEFLKMAMRSLEDAFHEASTAEKTRRPEDWLRGRK